MIDVIKPQPFLAVITPLEEKPPVPPVIPIGPGTPDVPGTAPGAKVAGPEEVLVIAQILRRMSEMLEQVSSGQRHTISDRVAKLNYELDEHIRHLQSMIKEPKA